MREAFVPGTTPPHAEERPKGASRSTHNGAWEEWQIPREAEADWTEEAKKVHAEWWQGRIARQKEIDASIAAKAEFEYLHDKPYIDNSRIRVAGPFTVESLSPHRVMPGDADDSLIHEIAEPGAGWADFGQMVLENLKTAGVQQAHKEDRITFTALTPWPGKFISAEGRYSEGGSHPSLPRLRGREGWGHSAKSAPRSWSGRNSVPCSAPTWSRRRAKPPTQASTS